MSAAPVVLDASADPAPTGHRWVRWLLLAVCMLIAAMWVYAFAFAPTKGAYRVEDAHWRAEAQRICTDANTARNRLADTSGGYIANPTPAQMVQRADVVDRSTDILERMLDDVAAVPLTGERDRLRVQTVEKYYRIIIGDRRAYTARLRQLHLDPYRETAVHGGPVSNVVTDFTSGNDIKACVPPGELGGD